jgi:colicin import membrane protein
VRLKTLQFLLRVIWGALRGRPVTIKPAWGSAASGVLTPQGAFLPSMAGGDETPEEKAAREEAEEAARVKAEKEAAEAEAEAERAEEERKAAEEAEAGNEWEGEVDKKKAERAVRNARAAEKVAKDRADAAEARARELEQAQESEHETAKREATEAKLEVEREREASKALKVTLALREAAAEADVPPRKVSRLLKMVDRDGIAFDAEGDVDAETADSAIADVLEEFPEFKAAATPLSEEEKEEKPGGAPDRKRKPKDLTRKDVEKMAREDPDKLNELIDEGKVPASALG